MEKVNYKEHYYTASEIKIIACDLNEGVPVKEIARSRRIDFNRRGPGLLKKIRQIKRALIIGFSLQEIIDNKTTESYNKQPKTMKKIKFYTEEEKEIIKSAIASGESFPSISKRLSIEFNREERAIYQKLLVFKKTIPVSSLAEIRAKKIWIDAKKTPVKEPTEIGIEVPNGMTFEGKPKKIMLHSDHFRIYF